MAKYYDYIIIRGLLAKQPAVKIFRDLRNQGIRIPWVEFTKSFHRVANNFRNREVKNDNE